MSSTTKSRLFALTIIALCAINCATGVDDGSAAAQVGQCTCDEQHKCFVGMEGGILGCMEQCKVEVNLKQALNNSMNAEQCFDFGKKLLADFFNCCDMESKAKDSCGAGAVKVDANNFENIMGKYMQKMSEKKQQTFNQVTSSLPNVSPLIGTLTAMSKCATECALGKLQSQGCFAQQKCDLNVTDAILQQTLNKCLHQMNPKEKMAEACKCFEQNGVMDVKVFCEKVAAMPIPEF